MTESHGNPNWLDEAAQEAKEHIECLYQEGLMLLSMNRFDNRNGLLPETTTESADVNAVADVDAHDSAREGTSS